MPKVKITTDRTWVHGSKAKINTEYEVTAEEAKILIANGFASEVITTAKKSAPKRARNTKGRLKADDLSTPDVNEAWVGGKAPRK
jgi:hypothetical protein